MAQFERVIDSILGIQYKPKITQATYQYRMDAKKYIDIIKNLNKKGISNEKLKKAGFITPDLEYLLEPHVNLQTMGGGPGGGAIPLPGLPGLGPRDLRDEDVNVTQEQINTLRFRLQGLQRVPQNTDLINELLRLMSENRLPNETNEQFTARYEKVAHYVQQLETEEGERFMRSERGEPEPEMKRGSDESKLKKLAEKQEREEAEKRREAYSQVNDLLNDFVASQLRYISAFTDLQNTGYDNMNEYAITESPDLRNNIMNRDPDILQIELRNEINRFRSYTGGINVEIRRQNKVKPKPKSPVATVTRTTRTIPNIEVESFREKLLQKYNKPSLRQKNKMATSSINPAKSEDDIETMQNKMNEILSTVGVERNEAEIEATLKKIYSNIKSGKKSDNTDYEKLHTLKTKKNPKGNVSRTFLNGLLASLSSDKNKNALYLNVALKYALKEGKKGQPGPLATDREVLLRNALKSDVLAQEIADIFSYYGINIANATANARGYERIRDQINALEYDKKLEIYNTIAYVLKDNGAPHVVIRRRLSEPTDLNKLQEAEKLREKMLSSLQNELVFTPEEINKLAAGFGRMGISQTRINELIAMNTNIGNRILTAQQNLKISELKDKIPEIRKKLNDEMMAMFEVISTDLNKNRFSMKEFVKFIQDIIPNYKAINKAYKNVSPNSLVQVHKLYRDAITDIPDNENQYEPNIDNPFDFVDDVQSYVDRIRNYGPLNQYMDDQGVSQQTRDEAAYQAARFVIENGQRIRKGQLLNIYGIYVARSVEPERPQFDVNLPYEPIIPQIQQNVAGGDGGPPGPPGPPAGLQIYVGGNNWRRRLNFNTLASVLGLLGLGYNTIKYFMDKAEKGEKVTIPIPDKKKDDIPIKQPDVPVKKPDVPPVIEYDDRGYSKTPNYTKHKDTDNIFDFDSYDYESKGMKKRDIPPVIEYDARGYYKTPITPIPYKDSEDIQSDPYDYEPTKVITKNNITSNNNTINNNMTNITSNNTHDVNFAYANPTVQKNIPKINVPEFDRTNGASPIEYTPYIEENSVFMNLTDEYNFIVTKFNESLNNKAPEETIKKYEDKLRFLSGEIGRANKTSLLNEKKFEAVEFRKSVYKQTPSGNIMTYDYMSTSPYTDMLGISDEIIEYNKQAEMYNNNVRAGKYLSSDLFPFESKIIQLQTNIRKISMNPEEARQLNQARTLRTEYPKDVRELMHTVITSADNPNRKPIDYSKSDLVDFPEVEKTLKSYNDSIETLKLDPNNAEAKQSLLNARDKLYDMSRSHAKTSAEQTQAFNEQKDKDTEQAYKRYNMLNEQLKSRPYDTNLKRDVNAAYDYYKKVKDSKAPTNNLPDIYDPQKYNDEYNKLLLLEQSGAGAKTEGMLYGLEGMHVTPVQRPDDSIVSNYNSSSKEYFDAKAKYDSAVEHGMNRSVIETLYTDMFEKYDKYKNDKSLYDTSFNKYYRDKQSGATWLNNDDQETAPQTEEEKEKFRRLQNIEKIIQTNKDAVIEYNDSVRSIDKNQSALDIYNKRVKLLRDISQKYGLQSNYNTAATENLNTSVSPDTDTIVKLPGDTSKFTENNDGHDRALIIDPAEYMLFDLPPDQLKIDQQNFEDFSKVQENHGLGSLDPTDRVNYNPLLVNQRRDDIKRYAKATKKPKPTINEMKLNTAYDGNFSESRVSGKQADQPFYQDSAPSSFGKVYYEDVQYNPYIRDKHVIFTDELKRSSKWSDFENPYSVMQPDYALFNKTQHPRSVIIGDISRPPGYEYTNQRSEMTVSNNPNYCELAQKAGITPKMTGDNPTMRNDQLFCKEYKSIYSGLSKYQY